MNPFLKDIFDQPDEFAKLSARWREDAILHEARAHIKSTGSKGFLLTGMGASHFAAYVCCVYLQDAGIPAFLEETSELLLYGLPAILTDITVIVISQSGESIEVQELLHHLKNKHRIVGITNEPENPLGEQCDCCIPLGVQKDHSIATKTYLATIATLLATFSSFHDEENEIPNWLDQVAISMEVFLENWQNKVQPAIDFIGDVSNVTFIGFGPSLASAWEGALLFKEGAKLQADGISGGQFRHGAIEVVDEQHTSILFANPGRSFSQACRLIDQILSYNGRVLVVSDELMDPRKNLYTMLRPSTTEFLVPLLEILPIQLLAYEIARQRGFEPGIFRNTTPVIRSY